MKTQKLLVIMKGVLCAVVIFVVGAAGNEYNNVVIDAADLQLLNFSREHPKPKLATISTGKPVEIREWNSLNTDIATNDFLIDSTMTLDGERIPERVVHAKGGGALGYFELTNDVSNYTKADVFNGIGKKTPIAGRFSTVAQNLGGTDLVREMKALAIKFYTKEGNLDFVNIHFPVYFYRDPVYFVPFARCFKRNPRTALFDFNARWDFITKRPDSIHGVLWLFSDYGFPDGYRKMDIFPIHTYELVNKHGEKFYARFNFRSEQGLANLTTAQAQAINDMDYYNRDLFNAIEEKNYPSWRLEMYEMTPEDIKRVNYNPFDVTRTWKYGDYRKVNVGRVVLNQNPGNFFRDIEQSAFSPSNLVPGIPGPVDFLFKARRVSYRDTQNHRLGRNHDKIYINQPHYAKTYNRDGYPPVDKNMEDFPNYFPNSFNGPVPYVDDNLPHEKLVVLESNAVDLQPAADFYNKYVKDEAHRDRLATNVVESFQNVYPDLIKRAIRLLSLVDTDLGKRVREKVLLSQAITAATRQILGDKSPVPDYSIPKNKQHD